MKTSLILLLILSICIVFSPHVATAEDTSIARQQTNKIAIGQDLPNIKALATQSVKGLFYALIGLGLFFYCFKKFPRAHATQHSLIEVVSRRVITPKTSLIIVRIGDEQLLLSSSQDQLAFLTHLEATTVSDDEIIELSQQYAASDSEIAFRSHG